MRQLTLLWRAHWLWRGVALASALSGLSRTARAQSPVAPRSAPSIALLADSIAARGDSARAYALLDSALHVNRLDAAAWHQFGLLSWNMAKAKRDANYMGDQRAIRLLRTADSALRLATQFAPDSARYWLALGRFNLTSGVSTMRFAASGQVGSALTAARKVGDTLLLAAASDEVGMAVWRRYEGIANRALGADGQRIQLSTFNNWNRARANDYVNSIVHKILPPTGERDYLESLEHFREAVQADPTNLRYSRHLFMAYGERGRWNEMLDLANRRARAYPLDFQAQLARALALHRLNNDKLAQTAFDSAAALMDDGDRARLSRFTRILRPKPAKDANGAIGDTLSFAKLPPAQQRGLEEMYWFMSDPLSLTAENEFRIEFLARVTWSDFRWTNDDSGLLGADTDRGDIHVRYGPPDLEITVSGSPDVQQEVDGEGNVRQQSNQAGGTTLVWGYNNGLVFFFNQPPGFGTARFALSDRDNVDQIKNAVPVSWANIPISRLLDTIPIRIARFRASGDSTDAVIAARIPLDSLVRGLDLTSAPVDVDIRVYDQFVRVKGVESTQQSVRPDSVQAPLAREWRKRLGPGINVVRVEALQADSKRAARAMSRLNPEPATGFGMSDILLGDKPVVDGAAPKRWSDVRMRPDVGRFASGASIGLLWEMYDLAPRDGSNKYRVSIVVERSDRSAVGSFAARLVDGLGRTLGRAERSRDKLTIAFDRSAAAASTLVEMLSLDLSDASAGSYQLRVEIADIISGKKTSQRAEFTIGR